MKKSIMPVKKSGISKRKIFMSLKEPDKVNVPQPQCTQDMIEIKRKDSLYPVTIMLRDGVTQILNCNTQKNDKYVSLHKPCRETQ
jgi:hypothetical protein